MNDIKVATFELNKSIFKRALFSLTFFLLKEQLIFARRYSGSRIDTLSIIILIILPILDITLNSVRMCGSQSDLQA